MTAWVYPRRVRCDLYAGKPARAKANTAAAEILISTAGLPGFYILCFLRVRAAPSCRRKVEMSPGAQSRDDTPLGVDTTSATLHQSQTPMGIKLLLSVTGEAEAGSAEEQPAEE